MTCEHCSIFNEPYKMINLWSLLHLFNGAKRMGFVLTFVFTEMNAQFQCNYIRYGTIIQQVYSSFIWFTKQNSNIDKNWKIFLSNNNYNIFKRFFCNFDYIRIRIRTHENITDKNVTNKTVFYCCRHATLAKLLI